MRSNLCRMQTQEKHYDYAFIFQSLNLYGYSSGGDKVVFELLKKLTLDHYKCAIILNDIDFDTSFRKNDNLMEMSINLFNKYIKKFPKFIQLLLPKIYFMVKNEKHHYSFMKHIDLIPATKFINKSMHSKNLIATWFGTSFIASKLNSNNKYYLIQNNEDDPSFSGYLSKYAKESYNLDLKKIVINNSLYEKFKSDDPLKIKIGIDYNFWFYNSKKYNDVLLPFKILEYKGFKYALEAAIKIHEKNKNITIRAFGNVNKKYIPDFIDYYYNPSNNLLKSLYAASKIFVLPSIVEGFPLVNLEAMAAGCVVLSTDFVGYDDYLINDYNAIILKRKDSGAIADSVLNTLNDENKMLFLRENGYKTSSTYSYNEMYLSFKSAMENAHKNI